MELDHRVVFVGDIAGQARVSRTMLPDVDGTVYIGNLEGPIWPSDEAPRAILETTQSALAEMRRCGFVGYVLANNHVGDANGSIVSTIVSLQRLGLKHAGAGRALSDASRPLVHEVSWGKLAVLGAGWSAIGCRPPGRGRAGVNVLRAQQLVEQVRQLAMVPDLFIVPYLHWGYEFECAPLPGHRRLAHALIDAGAHAVVGAHAHRVQGLEFYKERPIAYGLGNWSMPAPVIDGMSRPFPGFCSEGWGLEIGKDEVFLHRWSSMGDAEAPSLRYQGREPVWENIGPLGGATAFELSDEGYRNWFLVHRQVRSLVPAVRDYAGGRLLVEEAWLRLRAKIVHFLSITKRRLERRLIGGTK